jgi:hypothetical protein
MDALSGEVGWAKSLAESGIQQTPEALETNGADQNPRRVGLCLKGNYPDRW